ncbi:MAG TPA: hypothetical protein VN950_28810 [Terriglobales bacterium]|nr:hypothetical protein [Terriglobales bacterium]
MFHFKQKFQAPNKSSDRVLKNLRLWIAQRFGFSVKHHSETGFTVSCHIQFHLHDAEIISRAYFSVTLVLDLPSGSAGRSEPHHTRSTGRKYLVRYLAQFGERQSSVENDPQSLPPDCGAIQSVGYSEEEHNTGFYVPINLVAGMLC